MSFCGGVVGSIDSVWGGGVDGALVGSIDGAGVSFAGDGFSGTTFKFVCGWSVTKGELSGAITGLEPSGLTLNSNPEEAGESDTSDG